MRTRTVLFLIVTPFTIAFALLLFSTVFGGYWILDLLGPFQRAENNPNPPVAKDDALPLTILRHGGNVHSLIYSPDSKYIVAGTIGAERTIKADHWLGEIMVFDALGEEKVYYRQFDQWIQGVAMNGVGDRLLVACSSHNISGVEGFLGFVQKPAEIFLFEFPSMKELTKKTCADLGFGCSFSLNGKLVSIARAKDLKSPTDCVILDANTLEEKLVITANGTCRGGIFDPDGETVYLYQKAIGRGSGMMGKYQLADGKELDSWQRGMGEGVFTIARKPGFICHSFKSASIFYSTKTWLQEPTRFRIFIDPPQLAKSGQTSSCVSHDERFAVLTATSGRTASVFLEDAETKEIIKVFESRHRHGKPTFPVCAFAPDGKTFAVGAAGFRHIGDNAHGHVLLFKMPPRE